ncbi:tRNA threonylcarbamoyladenosine biosynthesis protein TsaB [Gimesia panareensis]|uniref:tRNA threonylcarbamoyladenosine biosynthesis protein TsaB n=1 Tax=Gimesia panareensis TaxID=2527978 RepID=A0A518FJS5_9PLAN|nr:tRNA (adenosine(37)-N6)-threonylcarbamoyltransferase complex dimerization subunit type 1 TsaB [Gimesia panareensis]QDV16601.1 tRNA threonylcarbamoyladenosine biosynthesis protein TsaB [Gimesia panareensis]
MENSEFYLGIDTSGRSGSIAVHCPGQEFAPVPLQQQGRKHAQTLVSEARKLLDRLQISPRQISGIGVSRGPGSFTGLRIGITFARTFGYVTGAPVLGIDTFEAIALSSPADLQETWVISNAQRGDLFVGKYTRIAARQWQQTRQITLREITEFSAALQPGEAVSGPGIDLLDQNALPEIQIVDTPRNTLAAQVAEITARLLTQPTPPTSEVWSLTPFYLRKSAAEEKWDARNTNQDR